MRFPQGETTECLHAWLFRCSCLFYRLREQRHGIGDASAQGIRCTQGRSNPGEIRWEVCLMTDAHSPFEQGDSSGQVTLAEAQPTDPVIGKHQARGVVHFLGNPQTFVPKDPTLGERA
jgi:hypothetical protein